ncbi:MAG: hypothetical protein K2X77_07875 [Candidatus Obscuribacterales bacterium]|nr:hypothetical protein [Candidatus Obscuribacterales bacterium]
MTASTLNIALRLSLSASLMLLLSGCGQTANAPDLDRISRNVQETLNEAGKTATEVSKVASAIALTTKELVVLRRSVDDAVANGFISPDQEKNLRTSLKYLEGETLKLHNFSGESLNSRKAKIISDIALVDNRLNVWRSMAATNIDKRLNALEQKIALNEGKLSDEKRRSLQQSVDQLRQSYLSKKTSSGTLQESERVQILGEIGKVESDLKGSAIAGKANPWF